MSSDATAEGYLQRAQLLADLGRYDEAAGEVGLALALEPANADALTTLARVHLAAGRPAEARAAAEAALAVAPDTVAALVARGLALVEQGEYAEAAGTAGRLLAAADDAYAQRSAAAILSGSRNGQPALNAAWRGVELAPEESQAHLVLALVAARLRLYDLAERAYREALRLDPELDRAGDEPGIVRLERRRYASALAELAENVPAVQAAPAVPDSPRGVVDDLRRLVLYGAGWTLVGAVLVAVAAAGVSSSGPSRFLAVLVAVSGAVLGWLLAARVPGLTRTVLPGLLRSDRSLALAVYAVAAGPLLLLLYAVVGTPWPLVAAIAVAAVAELAVFSRTVR
ncbi:tetratricopeptide repeat protein [Micromonospora carbonacea]|uniref:Tetratricopeptide repeat protein n=1 Tax=Micromonospora carbonacea TaxID=47853 RepID=A0A7H8XSU9_9ACTN|nr:tetratricopeptide repeat protein [Micromonospora carbonacea]MBB5823964.1 tetratricopeptide (TPR) repeat protein [Micromonospora carbonacea]QLD27770.1 tetratricopeptide repeat protein [Micromonospora carbonacea]